VGPSTAASICVFAYGQRQAILDGNAKRVLARFRGIKGHPGERKVADRLWSEARKLLPRRGVEAYTQGLMDLGATVCTRSRPRCAACPVHARCVAYRRGWTGSVPAPRPRRKMPHKRTLMLVLARAGEILLEKRPPSGIWGGLWCLPEAAPRTDIGAYCLKRFGAHVLEAEELPKIAHGFTHFRLDIRPLRLRVSALVPDAAEPGTIWLPLEAARGAAIPAPVRRILALL
jgi:A/G-specific adenine glycosylase